MHALTEKAQEILFLLVKGNPDGSFLDLDQLCAGLSYKPSKDSLHFSIRALIGRGLVEKKPRELRRGQRRTVLAPTMAGYQESRSYRRS